MSDSFRRFMVRIAACKATLALISDATARVAASAAQRAAMMSQLTAVCLSGEESALAVDALAAAGLEADDLQTVLDALVAGAPKDRRRPNQDFLAWSFNLSANEWKALAECRSNQAAAAFLVDQVVKKMKCIHPTEFTKKNVASGVLARRLNKVTY